MPPKTMILVAALSLLVAASGGGQALAATQCRDATGKFIKCPTVAVTPAATKCRDIKTKKYAKCGAPGTEAVPAKK